MAGLLIMRWASSHRDRGFVGRRFCHYKTLGVSSYARSEEIRNAYYARAKDCHPDVNAAPDANERFRLLKEAYETLADDRKRRRYDRELEMSYPPKRARAAASSSSWMDCGAKGCEAGDDFDEPLHKILRLLLEPYPLGVAIFIFASFLLVIDQKKKGSPKPDPVRSKLLSLEGSSQSVCNSPVDTKIKKMN